RANRFVRKFGAGCTLALLGAVGWTAYRYYHHDHTGQDLRSLPLPIALHVSALLLVSLAGQLTGWWERSNFFKDFCIGVVTLAICAATFPVANFVCIGQAEDRTACDVAVVVAARSDTDKEADTKSPNPLLSACQLYRDGQIKKVLLLPRPNES